MCNGLCHHLYKCDSLCYDYMNGNICKHLHRIHSLQCVSITEENVTESMDISFDNDDTTATTDCEEGETKKDPYCLPSKRQIPLVRSNHKYILYTLSLIPVSMHIYFSNNTIIYVTIDLRKATFHTHTQQQDIFLQQTIAVHIN